MAEMNIAIVGGGSSGLFLAQKLSRNSANRVIIFEKSGKVGTKLKASGGGKANIFNTNISGLHYNNANFMSAFLQEIDAKTIEKEFRELGLKMSVDEENRVYPSTYFSQTVLDVLLLNLSSNVTIKYDFEVKRIFPSGQQWRINDYPILFDKIVLASGSPAGMIAANRNNYNVYLTAFGLEQSQFIPSLVGFKIKNYRRSLSGCRTKAIVSLCQTGKVIFTEKGEVIFKDDGISGIVILNCSAYYNRLLKKNNCSLSLNFLYDDDHYDLAKHWEKYHNYCGILHPKLNDWYAQSPFDLRNLRLEIEDTYELDTAQVCHGGIALSEIDEHFQLKKYKNIYVTGELLDIDGVCGGYNLFFAFASALKVAKEINYGN